jgi:hypothetical protein
VFEGVFMSKTIIEAKRISKLVISVSYVFKSNFNDTYFLDKSEIDLKDLCKDELVWIDPFLNKVENSNILIALSRCTDDEFVILEKRCDEVKEYEHESYLDHIITLEYDESKFIAAHIRLKV